MHQSCRAADVSKLSSCVVSQYMYVEHSFAILTKVWYPFTRGDLASRCRDVFNNVRIDGWALTTQSKAMKNTTSTAVGDTISSNSERHPDLFRSDSTETI